MTATAKSYVTYTVLFTILGLMLTAFLAYSSTVETRFEAVAADVGQKAPKREMDRVFDALDDVGKQLHQQAEDLSWIKDRLRRGE